MVTGAARRNAPRRDAAEDRGRRRDRHRAHRRRRHHRRVEEERRRRRRAVQRRAVGHRHPRVPAADLGHQQAVAAARRRPSVRGHQPGHAPARQRRSHRGAEGRRRRRSTAPRRWAGWSTSSRGNREAPSPAGAPRRRQLQHIGVRRAAPAASLVARRLRRQRLAFNQRDDFRMGNGVVRPATSYKTYDGSARVGVDLGGVARGRPRQRLSWPRHQHARRPVSGVNVAGPQGSRAVEPGRARCRGPLAGHTPVRDRSTAPTKRATRSTSPRTNPLDLPFLPYLTFENELGWTRRPVTRRLELVARQQPGGGPRLRARQQREPFVRPDRRAAAPFSADSRKHTVGLYAENTLDCRTAGRSSRRAAGSIGSRPRRWRRRSRPTSRRPRRRSPCSIRASA